MSDIQQLLAPYPRHYATVPSARDFVEGRREFNAASQFTRHTIFEKPYDFKTVVITGTNGKGSTGSILTKMCIQSGLRVGTISSPAMREDCTDMIKVNGSSIAPEKLLANLHDALFKLEPIRNNPKLTHYMPICIAAYDYFRERKVDVVIAETAIGGLHDPTVPFKSDVCLFTNITADHEDVLGNTFNQVARHKSRIIGVGSTVILGEQITDELAGTISRYARRKTAEVKRVDVEKLTSTGLVYDQDDIKITGQGIYCPKYQHPNLRLAAEAFFNLGLPNRKAISLDLNQASVDGLFPENRYELRVRNGVRYLFDSAHNTGSYEQLTASLAEHFDWNNLYFFKGASTQNSLDEFQRIVQPRHVVYVSGYHGRVIKQDGFVDLADINFREVEDQLGSDKIIVICGIFLSPKVKEILFPNTLEIAKDEYSPRPIF